MIPSLTSEAIAWFISEETVGGIEAHVDHRWTRGVLGDPLKARQDPGQLTASIAVKDSNRNNRDALCHPVLGSADLVRDEGAVTHTVGRACDTVLARIGDGDLIDSGQQPGTEIADRRDAGIHDISSDVLTAQRMRKEPSRGSDRWSMRSRPHESAGFSMSAT